MAKKKRIINCIVPVTACNFRCTYCYIGQTEGFSGAIDPLPFPVEYISRALSLKRLGGPCIMNLCGMGETLLAPYVPALTKAFLQEGHYVTVVSNAVLTEKIKELLDCDRNLLDRLFVKCSFHYLELKQNGLLDCFFNNIQMLKNAGVSFSVELTANDESIPYIDEIKSICQDRMGVLCHIIESRNQTVDTYKRLTKLDVQEHLQHWESFDSPLISFQKTVWEQKRTEFCYAGDWVLSFYLDSGNFTCCFGFGHILSNAYANLDEPLSFAAIGRNCTEHHCFAAYVLLTNGAIPTIQTPTYAELRDRVCQDGSRWLTPAVSQFFSSKFSEGNDLYSPDKVKYIDALMSFDYENSNNPYHKDEIAALIAKHLKLQGVSSIGVWGDEKLGQWFVELIKGTDIQVKFIVSHVMSTSIAKNIKANVKRNLKYTIRRLQRGLPVMLAQSDRLPKVDAVIISSCADYNQLKSLVSSKTKARILPLTQVIEK